MLPEYRYFSSYLMENGTVAERYIVQNARSLWVSVARVILDPYVLLCAVCMCWFMTKSILPAPLAFCGTRQVVSFVVIANYAVFDAIFRRWAMLSLLLPRIYT